ncbi:hypothetical protein NC652_012193 [Populus alba x Populus x berolinensis]|nr:hypothetical protein NC652_012193 [Populus alba x Populus x berolinensis]
MDSPFPFLSFFLQFSSLLLHSICFCVNGILGCSAIYFRAALDCGRFWENQNVSYVNDQALNSILAGGKGN